jgi:predicted dehydrogenase
VSTSLTRRRRRQLQPWVAGRAEGGPLREVGTHFFFALQELFGACCVGRVRAQVDFADGPGGSRSEVAAQGLMVLGEAAGALAGLEVKLSLRTDSSASVGDVYELEVVRVTRRAFHLSVPLLCAPGRVRRM